MKFHFSSGFDKKTKLTISTARFMTMYDCFQRKTNLVKSQHYYESQQLAATFNRVFPLSKCQSTFSQVKARTGIFLVNDGCDYMKPMCMKSPRLFVFKYNAKN